MEREDERLLIGEVARLTGFPAKTLRYYEEIGLVQPASRTEAGYRLYGQEEVARLEFVRQAKLIGLKLEEIKELSTWPPKASGARSSPAWRRSWRPRWRRLGGGWRSWPSSKSTSFTTEGEPSRPTRWRAAVARTG